MPAYSSGMSSPPSPTSLTQAAYAVGARQVPRRLWQPDHEAEECSLLQCGNKFGYWPNGERRHHCRQCGRVVCGSCSGRMKMLLPPQGERGPPRNVRVCEACFLSQETFTFPRSGSHTPCHFLSPKTASGSPTRMGCTGFAVPPSPVPPNRRVGQLRSSTSSPALLQQSPGTDESAQGKGEKAKASILRRDSDSSINAADHGMANASSADSHMQASPRSDSKSSRGTTSPVWVPRLNFLGQVKLTSEASSLDADVHAAERLFGDIAPENERRLEWIASVQKKFGADPHYHAMLKYEPLALKALITCTMAP